MSKHPLMVAVTALVAVLAGCGTTTGPPHIPAYDPKYFGTSWPRIHGNCDLREVILERDSITPVDVDQDGCRDDGQVIDPYTGELVSAKDTQIDHVLSKQDAWYAGAWAWSPAQRRIFFTDQANLRAVLGSLNESKGDRGPDQWRPSRVGWCAYSSIYSATAARWQLTVSPAKRAALTEMLATCGVPAPSPSPVPPPCGGEKPGVCPGKP